MSSCYYVHVRMRSQFRSGGSYERLCDAVEQLDGTVRLARREPGWGLTATIPPEDDPGA